jgi:hypothetical protein
VVPLQLKGQRSEHRSLRPQREREAFYKNLKQLTEDAQQGYEHRQRR